MTATQPQFPPETDAIAAMIAMLERRAARVESFREYRRAGRLRRFAELARCELESVEA